MENIFFGDWQGLLRAFVITIMAYVTLVIFIRISGKRTLAKMNAFDFIVTVALGSCLATISLNRNVALAEGALVFFTLIVLQFIISFLSVRIKQVKKLVSSQPVMLLYNGVMLTDMMRRERITSEAIFLSAREKGISNLEDIAVIVLETTGDLTLILKKSEPVKTTSALQDVRTPA